MRLLFLLPIIFFGITSNATNYYISASGNDANNGTSISTPWKTLSKLNSYFGSLKPGDNVLFNRGDVFYGSMIISQPGTAGSPITIGAYGSGTNPIITGFTNVTAWTNLGGNIWESTSAVSSLTSCNMVVISGVNTAMGRYPNSGWLTYQSFSGNTSVTSSSLNAAVTNWTGAEVVIKKQRWIIERCSVTSAVGATLNYSGGYYNGQANWGLFIQNDARTLDIQNEWYYNPTTKKIRIYSKNMPVGVQISTISDLVTIMNFDYINFDGVDFTGANNDAFNLGNTKHIAIQNSNITFCGNYGISGSDQTNGLPATSQGCIINSNTFNSINNNSINLSPEYGTATITNNIIRNNGMLEGMAGSGDGAAYAIRSQGINSTIQYNTIDTTGYIGIGFDGAGVNVSYNYINGFCFFKDDGGAIYGSTGPSGKIISYNTILNGIGNNSGVPYSDLQAQGIYLDNYTSGANVFNNNISNISDNGILLHNPSNITLRSNTVYNCNYMAFNVLQDDAGYHTTGLNIKNNIFFCRITTQLAVRYFSMHNDFSSWGIIDSNYYARPTNDNLTIDVLPNGNGGNEYNYNLAQWQTFSGFDKHSNKSPKTITDTSDLRYEYYANSDITTLSLDANYIDVKGVSYNGSVTLAPYSSAVLIKTGSIINPPPVANAGKDQIIQLPKDSINLSGSGVDSNGIISSYSWSKISGPANYNIVNSASAITVVTGLVQGTYQFQLTVTDNLGATGKDTMTVTVNAANIPPIANAGQDQVITLPTNSLTLSGSGKDSDGVVTGYLWTKISGPPAVSISNPTLVTTSVTGLIKGVYQFALLVTDNNGAITADTMAVTVNPLPNQVPVANAGPDQNITLPANFISLSGGGNDPDGTIVSYLWSKISGPSSYSMSNSSSALTNVSNLVQGVYTFQLQVTDNNGATGTDILQVTVNAVANIPPVASAGSDQTIILPVNAVTLSGSGKDSDGTVASYIWTQLSGPSSYNITDAASPLTDVTGLVQGIYQFQLEVIDNNGAIGASTVSITVNRAANISPIANAGQPQLITLPTNSLTLSGTGNDQDGTVVSYKWTKISGPASYNITNATSPVTSITALSQGIYRFQLSVTDNDGAIGTSVVQITVNAAGNIPPVANAGADQIITLPITSITLSGSGSDSDGKIVSYLWTKLSGPSSYNIIDSTSAVTDVNALVQGNYQFELQVTDNDSATGTGIIQITVNAPSNIPPVAVAGSNQAITLPVNYTILSGKGSDTDGTIVSYQWSKISGPSNYSIANAAAANTTITGLVQGVYQFELQVTDDKGATGTAIEQITVNAPVNIPPVANAGLDQSITLPVDSLTLTGSGEDQDGTIVGFTWTKISGPATYHIINASSAITNVIGLTQGIYQFELEVTDDSGAVASDTMQLIVNPSLNLPPIADAGPDQLITLPVNHVTISGSGQDSDGTIVGYVWTKISGPSNYNIANSTSSATTISGLTQGIYQFELKVTDDKGGTASDTLMITVNTAGNLSPTANAGPDQTITLPKNSISLSGSGTDPDGTIASYLWTKISGPSGFNILNATAAITNVNRLTQGVYQFQLQVTDDKGAIGTDIMQVTVNVAPNQPPVANAGPDQTITLPTNSLTLYGNGTDADGTIVSYAWTKISGPSTYNIVNDSSSSTGITNLIKGVYTFQLKVTDNNGASATNVVKITVNAAPNIPPVANAGGNQSVTLPNNKISLAGSGTDADGSVVSYQWIKISGPSSYNIVNYRSPVTDVSGLVEGSYQFQLKVTDNNGAIGTSVIQVIVNAAVNIPPIANAGPDQIITLPLNTITLNGSGTDSDGTVASYLWTKISGPAGYNLLNAKSSGTSVTNLLQGVYQFKLEVTDNNGAMGTDVVHVTVNPAPNQPPVANAGADQIITLPVNSLTLSGSGTDADGSIVSYNWAKISGPSNYNITNSSSSVTNITELVQGVYQFQLKVTDNNNATSTDIVRVTVNAAPNQPPVAKAGSDITITLPANTVVLSGGGTDVDGTVVSFSWAKISGPSNYSITNGTGALTNVSGLVQGVYQFELKVTDNDSATATDIVQVTVNATPNQPPVADAGINQTIVLPVNSVTLSGSGSDPDGTVISYTWSTISGPSGFNIINATSAVTNVTGLVQGVYEFELKVTDNNGGRARDTVMVTVNAATNIPPVANAGPDKTIILPVNVISLSGSGNDMDGTVIKYMWTKISGPGAYNIVNATSPVTDVSGLVQGTYKFELKVTDNSGATGRDTVQIVVKNANIPPVANAGPDQTITYPANSAILSGSGTDADGTIAGYIWKQLTGPSIGLIAFPSAAVTLINNLVGGSYEFELTVTDNNGAVGKDTVAIIVAEPRLNPNAQINDAKIYPNPVVDITTLEINTTQVNSKLGIVITNVEGSIVYRNEIMANQSNVINKLNLNNLAKGAYVITIYFGKSEKKSLNIIRL